MNNWELREIPFKYQLSDLTLFSVSLPMQCRTVSLLDESPPRGLPGPPIDELMAGSQGFIIRALPVSEELSTVSEQQGYIFYTPLQYDHCHIDLRQSFDDYQRKFSSKTRSTINRKVKKYAEHCGGSIPWRSYTKPEEMDEFFCLARAVSKLTYQERLLDVGIPGDEDFFREARALAAEDRLRAYILFDGERPVSYLYCPVEAGVLIYAYLGYDPEYMKMSVGTVLQWLALEKIFGEACFQAFDFTEGQSDHKRLFATHQRHCANVFMVRSSIRNKAVIYSQLFMNRFSAWLGVKLDQLGVKKRIKHLLRFTR